MLMLLKLSSFATPRRSSIVPEAQFLFLAGIQILDTNEIGLDFQAADRDFLSGDVHLELVIGENGMVIDDGDRRVSP